VLGGSFVRQPLPHQSLQACETKNDDDASRDRHAPGTIFLAYAIISDYAITKVRDKERR